MPLPHLVLAVAVLQTASPTGTSPSVSQILPDDKGPPAPLVAASWSPASGADVAGDRQQPLRRDGETTVEPGARFRVEAAVALRDARLVLYDAQDAMVPGEEAAEIGTAASGFRLTPARPLRPGSHYLLRLEGATGRDLHDLSGGSYRPLSFALLTAGEPAPARPARRKKARPR